MKLYCDLHIHSALSPCGDDDMTPQNIVNMAKLKGLDVIAVTDHNSCENTTACIEAGKRIGLMVIPGMEIQTREDIHALCLFSSVDKALLFQDYVYKNMPEIKNKEELFGRQLILNSKDEYMGICERMLLTSTLISFDDAYYAVCSMGGTFIPAHIDRDGFSVITSLGFMPPNLNIKTVEYHTMEGLYRLIKMKLINESYRFIKSSDAHYLGDISEREMYINVENFSPESIIKKLNS